MKKYGIIIFLILFLGYGLFEAKKLFFGPSLTIETPQNGQSFKTQTAELKGTASNVSFIRLGDRQIFVDKKGVFREPLILLSGYNIVRIEAEDRFGKKITKELKLFLYPEGFQNINTTSLSPSTPETELEATSTTSN